MTRRGDVYDSAEATRALRAENTRLWDALSGALDTLGQYATHPKTCAWLSGNGCTCGLATAEAELREVFAKSPKPDITVAGDAKAPKGDITRWQLTRAKSALENWGRHHSHCTYWDDDPHYVCSCGLADEIRAADPVNVTNSVGDANTVPRHPLPAPKPLDGAV